MFKTDLNALKKLALNEPSEVREVSGRDIAIIGVSCNLPGAGNVRAFWENLKKGVDCIRDFPASRRTDTENYLAFTNRLDSQIRYEPGAYLDRIDGFDFSYFRLSPREAGLMDPNQRLFLQSAWAAIEDAGYGGGKICGSGTGVYIGYCEALHTYRSLIYEMDPTSISVSLPGNLGSMIASRISYLLDLRGPAVSIDTACSSAFVALHTAIRSIRSRECEMALVGGVRLNLLPIARESKFGVESSDGRAKTFDDSSDGTGQGEGVIAILLKPLNKAIEDRDNIHAVIKGSAVNQDGASIGITAPNVKAQEEVIVSAWRDAGIDPETISFIEAHGTGTALGDPIEIDGLERAFRRYTRKKQFCAVGSVKTNLGHLDNAAGLVGMLKAVLSLKHSELPPSLHFKRPNRKIPFQTSPVYVNDRLQKWERGHTPRRCGISSFGLSGTNCHVVLEEYSAQAFNGETEGLNVLTLSASSPEGLEKLLGDYREVMEITDASQYNDLCYTANTGRGHYSSRLIIIAEGWGDLKSKIIRLHEEGPGKSRQPWCHYHDRNTRNIENNLGEEQHDMNREANEKVTRYRLANEKRRDLLEEICYLYANGADINWEDFYGGQVRTKVSVPAYPFMESRCWLSIPGKEKGTGLEKSAMTLSTDTIYRAPENEMERILVEVFQKVLGYDDIGTMHDFSDMGGDSVSVLYAVTLLKEKGLEVGATDIIKYGTAYEIARNCGQVIKTTNTQEHFEGETRVLPIQRAFLGHDPSEREAQFNLAVMLYRQEGFDEDVVRQVADKLVEYHDSLRSVFSYKNKEAKQIIGGLSGEYYTLKTFLCDKGDYQTQVCEEADRIHLSLDYETGPVFSLGVFKAKDGDHLLFVVSHYICDAYAMRILLEDFITGYKQVLHGQAIAFKPKTCSIREYTERVFEYSKGRELLSEWDFWMRMSKTEVPPLPYDQFVEREKWVMGCRKQFPIFFSEEDTKSLMEASKKHSAKINELLLAGVWTAVRKWANVGLISVTNESSGRMGYFDDMELDRTVGWLAHSHPLVFAPSENMNDENEITESIRIVKTALSEVPKSGFGFEILRYLTMDCDDTFSFNPEIFFNYNGIMDTSILDEKVITLSPLPVGTMEGLQLRNYFKLEFYISIVNGCLSLFIRYDERMYREETIQSLAQGYINTLRRIMGSPGEAAQPEPPIATQPNQ